MIGENQEVKIGDNILTVKTIREVVAQLRAVEVHPSELGKYSVQDLLGHDEQTTPQTLQPLQPKMVSE